MQKLPVIKKLFAFFKKFDTSSRVIIVLCIIFFLLHIPFFSLPPFGDANVYYAGVFEVLKNHFNPFIQFPGYKPPFLFLLTAFLFTLFRPSIIIGALLTAFAASCTLWFTYALGKTLFNKQAAIAATFLLLTIPIFLSQSLQFTDAIIITPLILASIYYFYTKNTLGYLISTSLAVLTRETCLFVPLFFGVIALWKKLRTPHTKEHLSQSVVLLAPLIPFILWMYINKQVFGWHLPPENVNYFVFDTTIFQRIIYNFSEIIRYSGSFILFTIISIYIIMYAIKKVRLTDIQQHAARLCIIGYLFYLTLYSIGPFHPRYMLFLYPFLCVLTGGAIYTIWKKQLAHVITGGIIILFLAFNALLCTLPNTYWGETDLNIVHVTRLYQQSMKTIETRFPHALVITMPWIYAWNDTHFGNTTSAVSSSRHTWNSFLQEKQQHQMICSSAKKQGFDPIIFIHQSDFIAPPYVLREKVLLNKQFNTPMDTFDYHLLFQVQCNNLITIP